MSVSFAIYDVFADAPFNGNQAAVLHEDLNQFSDAQLLLWAKEIALAETALSSITSNRLVLRFANASTVLPRCGHATLAGVADHVLSRLERSDAHAGFYRVGTDLAEWRAKLVTCSSTSEKNPACLDVTIAWPERPFLAGSLPADLVYDALNLAPSDRDLDLPIAIYNSGNRNAIVPVKTDTALKNAKPNLTKLASLFEQCQLIDLHLYLLQQPSPSSNQIHIRCRNFFPYGIFEEAATGTACLSLAAALAGQPKFQSEQAPVEFLFVQGSITRYGRLQVSWPLKGDETAPVWLSGRVFLIAQGEIAIPESK
jgi:trans-2,3-dihydro-3-hydroxyanthranilate isomerase